MSRAGDPDADAPLTHLDEAGRARMVDVGDKDVTAPVGHRGVPGGDEPVDGGASGRRRPAQG